jgi:hypothetical protein
MVVFALEIPTATPSPRAGLPNGQIADDSTAIAERWRRPGYL